MQFHTPITVYNQQYQATILENFDYLPSTWTNIQKRYLKKSLIKINLGALAENYMTQIHQNELQHAACHKETIRVVQKRRVITVFKA